MSVLTSFHNILFLLNTPLFVLVYHKDLTVGRKHVQLVDVIELLQLAVGF